MNIEERLKKLFEKTLKGKDINPDSDLKDLGLDSLDTVELIMNIEDEFNIEFENEEMVALKKVSDVYKAIEAKLQK